MTKRILITGGNSSFGTLMVEALLTAGHQVVASVRDPEGRNLAAANALRKQGAHVVELDVTDDASVERGVASALRALGGLDVLINNAGVGSKGLVEHHTPEDFARLFDVNVFGVQRVNRAILPHFREQQRGLLLHISSLLGRLIIPFYGPYTASKWALEALAETYRTELSQFGVESCLIEPGPFPTRFIDNLMRPSDHTRDAQYGEMANAPEAALQALHQLLENTPAQDPNRVARAVVDVVDRPRGQRPFRTLVDAIGMGDALAPYNEQLHALTRAIYSRMHIDHMLSLKT